MENCLATGWWSAFQTKHAHYFPKELPLACWLMGSPVDSWRWFTICALVMLYADWHDKTSLKSYKWMWPNDGRRNKMLSWIYRNIVIKCAHRCMRQSNAFNQAMWYCVIVLWHGVERMCHVMGIIFILEVFADFWDSWVFSPLRSMIKWGFRWMVRKPTRCTVWVTSCCLHIVSTCLKPVWWILRIVKLSFIWLLKPVCSLILPPIQTCLSWLLKPAWCIFNGAMSVVNKLWGALASPPDLAKLCCTRALTSVKLVVWLEQTCIKLIAQLFGIQHPRAIRILRSTLWMMLFMVCIENFLRQRQQQRLMTDHNKADEWHEVAESHKGDEDSEVDRQCQH